MATPVPTPLKKPSVSGDEPSFWKLYSFAMDSTKLDNVWPTLLTLAEHFYGEALENFQRTHKWLAVFKRAGSTKAAASTLASGTPDTSTSAASSAGVPVSASGSVGPDDSQNGADFTAQDSGAQWESARKAFMKDGPAFLDCLTLFTDLTRTENMLERLCAWIIGFPGLLLSIRDDLNSGHRRSIQLSNRRLKTLDLAFYHSGGMCDYAKNLDDEAKNRLATLSKAQVLARQKLESDGISRSDGVPGLSAYFIFVCIVRWLHDTKLIKHGSDPNSAQTRRHFKTCVEFWSNEINSDQVKNGAIWVDYKRKVRSLVSQLGCAIVHDEPEENIAELRVFHSTTIGYFAKLQHEYVQQLLEVKKLQEYIEVLEFRHLLEQLPPPELGNSATERWKKFWRGAVDNASKSKEPNHPLGSIVKEYYTKSKAPTAFHIQGELLYNTLSQHIHNFHGMGFKIKDDHRNLRVEAPILHALRPLEENILAESETKGEIDWAKERARYGDIKAANEKTNKSGQT